MNNAQHTARQSTAAANPFVTFTRYEGEGDVAVYIVKTHGRAHVYTVRILHTESGVRFGKCICPASMRRDENGNQAIKCKHIKAAALLDAAMQAHRRMEIAA